MVMNIAVTDERGDAIGYGTTAIESFGKAFLLPYTPRHPRGLAGLRGRRSPVVQQALLSHRYRDRRGGGREIDRSFRSQSNLLQRVEPELEGSDRQFQIVLQPPFSASGSLAHAVRFGYRSLKNVGEKTARSARSRTYSSASSRNSKAATGSSRSCCNHLFLRRVASLTPFASDTAP